jgi:uncharacterized HAD superfamily protein
MEKKPTVFCDIDGTLFKYRKFADYAFTTPEVCAGVVDKLQHWASRGVVIVLTTARPEHLRSLTISELALHAIPYAQLVMGIGRGPRFLINDEDPKIDERRATAFSIPRDVGLGDIEV